METTFIIIIFSAISFFVYGLNSFFSKRMINEYKRWGFSKFRKLISFLQILGACGLLLGLFVNFVLIISSLGLSLMMFSAIIVRIYINDNISRILPAITYFMLSALILIDAITGYNHM